MRIIVTVLIVLFLSGCKYDKMNQRKSIQACADHGGVYQYGSNIRKAHCNDGYHIELPETLKRQFWLGEDGT